MSIRVLVVDDSAFIRDVLSKTLVQRGDIEVVGTAADPIEAREKIKALNPDVLTLDIEMPNMNGLAFLQKIMRLRPMPVVMVSTLTQKGAGETMLALELKGGKDAAFRFLNALEIVKISNNLGDAKSIATHPATTTHQRLPADQKAALGITPGLVRLSVGLEDADDLTADLRRALDAV